MDRGGGGGGISGFFKNIFNFGGTIKNNEPNQNLVDAYTQQLPEGDKYLGFENVSGPVILTRFSSRQVYATATLQPRCSSTANPCATPC